MRLGRVTPSWTPLWVCAAARVMGVALLALGLPRDSSAQAPSAAYISVGVRVTDVNSEQPINQARVELLRFPDTIVQLAISDSTGQVEFLRVLANQTYVLRASKYAYQTSEFEFDTRREEFVKRLFISLRPLESKKPGAPGDSVSASSLGVPPEAAKEFREGLKLLNDRKDASGSLRYFQKAVNIWPNYAEAHFLMGMAYLQTNSAGEAEVALRKAMQIDPKLLGPYYPLAVLFFTQKRYGEDEELLRKAMALDPQGWQWPFELARCYAKQNQWEKALEYGQMAHERPNAPTKVHILMADLYSATGSPAKAIEELEKFARLDPSSPLLPRVQQALAGLRKPQ